MKLMRILAGLAVLAAAAVATAQIKWVPNFQTAMKRAKATHKAVMIEFYTAWDLDPTYRENTPGQQLEHETFADKAAQAVANKFVPVRIDVEKEGKDLGKKYHITNYPTVLFLDNKENVIGIIDGFEPAEEFVKHGNSFLRDLADYPSTWAKYKKNKKNLAAVTRLGEIYANRYDIDQALQKLAEAEKIDPANKTGKLSDLYNNIADYYQNASKYDPAIKYFKKTAETSKVTDKLAYANLSIVACYFSKDVPSDPSAQPDAPTIKKIRANFAAAKPYVEATLKLPHLKAEDRQIAVQDQRQIDQVLGGTIDDDGG
ncbi:MAG TPA: thioredoxin fold domain-containing protein [Fimbriimonadaceae bacterium]|nr:thioredoxin fold domain-containing protein [Fimbriimonadaceae bacterium]